MATGRERERERCNVVDNTVIASYLALSYSLALDVNIKKNQLMHSGAQSPFVCTCYENSEHVLPCSTCWVTSLLY